MSRIIVDVEQDRMGNAILTPRSKRIRSQMSAHNKEWTGHASEEVFLQEWRGDEFIDERLTSEQAAHVRRGYTVGIKMDPWEFGHLVGHDFQEAMNPNAADGHVYGQIGDMNPLDHSGGLVYESSGGPAILYTHGLEHEEGVGPYDEDVESVKLDVYEVPIEEDVVKDLSWVDWDSVASSIGMGVAELKGYARSSNIMARASVYDSVAGHYGWHELDSYPTKMTYGELDELWFPGGYVAKAIG
jgi:hypothetical protein